MPGDAFRQATTFAPATSHRSCRRRPSPARANRWLLLTWQAPASVPGRSTPRRRKANASGGRKHPRGGPRSPVLLLRRAPPRRFQPRTFAVRFGSRKAGTLPRNVKGLSPRRSRCKVCPAPLRRYAASTVQPSRCSGRSRASASALLTIFMATGSNSSGPSTRLATLPSRGCDPKLCQC